MKNLEEFIRDQMSQLELRGRPDVVWDGPQTLEAMDNLKRLWRLGFLTDKEADTLSRSVRSLYRKHAGLPRMDGDPVV